MTASTEARARGGFAALDPCVHCGFCLPACPTYLATGDENDSPRGRIVLMRALEAGTLPPDDPAVRHHLDACLGCRGCEPACPSGVAYGTGLEAARAALAQANGLPIPVRTILAVFRRPWLWRPALGALRWLRVTGIPARLAGWGRVGFGMGMVAGGERTGGWADRRTGGLADGRAGGAEYPGRTLTGQEGRRLSGGTVNDPPIRLPASPPARLALFRGCVTDTLQREVNDATVAVLRACGHELVEVPGQACCGALHAHAGARQAAAAMAGENLRAFAEAAVDAIVVNSAGCGALLREYAHLVSDPLAPGFSSRVRDVTEVLASGPLPPMGPLPLEVAYDPPCHLQHAQQVHDAPLAVLHAIPGLRVRLLPGHDRCCGGAGIYGLLHPALSRDVLEAKLDPFRQADPPLDAVATGNPGCLMQIGAGIRATGLPIRAVHPVQLVWEAMGGVREKGEARSEQ